MNRFDDRAHAGRELASQLDGYRERNDAIVLGLPRGGVPVAFEVAMALGLPLDVMIVRKLRTPDQPELAIGAIASGGISILNTELVPLVCDAAQLRNEMHHQKVELQRREALYRNGRLPLDIKRRTVILIDDGVATGASMRAAVKAARKLGAARVAVAVPVASPEALQALREEADEVVCLLEPRSLLSVGEWYLDFEQTDDSEVVALLAQSRAAHEQSDFLASHT